MRTHPSRLPLALALLTGLATAAQAQAPAQPPAADTPEQHLAAAKAAAAFDFTGTLARICVAPQTGPGADVAPRPPPARDTWYSEPARVFDNLYFVGTLVHSAWALTTSEGIILIDTLYDYATEEEIIGGLRKLGLDPASVKYVIVSHGHGDHVGGAHILQQQLGARVVMSAEDWSLVEASRNQFPNGKPRRDVVAMDGQTITLGDTAVRLIHTPGHTPGTLSMIFPVRDGARTLTVAYSGGTAFNFINDVPHFDTYIASQRRMAASAREAGATVLLSNHSEFDNAVTKIRMLPSRRLGEPSPFENGAEAVARYFRVTDECAQAARLRLMRGS
ncbi:MBL fold metallo-hydrolase [Roseomonas sp. BN140053]|uniref:MBL fold metallo-hydrolase n=1 Tax=Roseomonas sp. BN140053 TaxID=3391898 RepID=UPI0039EA9588